MAKIGHVSQSYTEPNPSPTYFDPWSSLYEGGSMWNVFGSWKVDSGELVEEKLLGIGRIGDEGERDKVIKGEAKW